MSAPPPDDQSDGRRVSLSKVSFSRISSDLLVVNIKKMNEEMREEDIPKPSSVAQHKPPMRKSRSYSDRKTTTKNNNSKSTMTEERVTTASSFSQTSSPEQQPSVSQTAEKSPSHTPCIKHAALNLSRKASDVPSEKINLCNNCSKSMLSYIFLVQDFLDSLAKEISGGEGSQCLQCARQEVRDNVASLSAKAEDSSHRGGRSERSRKHSGHESKSRASDSNNGQSTTPSRTRSSHQESRKNDDQQNRVANPHQGSANQQGGPRVEFPHNVSSSSSQSAGDGNVSHSSGGENRFEQDKQQSYQQNVHNQQQAGSHHHHLNQANQQQTYFDGQSGGKSHEHQNVQSWDSHQQQSSGQQQPAFIPPAHRVQPNHDYLQVDPAHYPQDHHGTPVVQHSPTVFKDGVDGIVSTLSNAEREIYDGARDGAGRESLTGPQERLLGLSPETVVSSEAYVTFCRNNAEAIGCLVVGTSLLLCRTTRTLCVLVSDGVSTAFKGALSSVFQVVQFVRSLDSLGTTKLALLEQPELGITFDKLNIWRLVQFTKCVYLNPDTLVIQNCDELFSREELSAVPDIGWPDCFNSGVFVFSPSIQTFWNLLEFSEKQGSYDGGDQGLLNSYFNSWSSDISKKLSFIYNLMANVSYTYTPAFRQFGRDVKIVQFHGSFKPWHVKFFPNSGQVSPSSPVHPTYIQFVHIWLNIFRISVLRLMSQEIQSYSSSQETICAVEILRFFPLPTESESDFFLTPPSVRLRLAERKLFRTASLPISEARRRKSAEFFRYTDPDEPGNLPDSSPVTTKPEEPGTAPESGESKAGTEAIGASQEESKDETDLDEVFKKLEAVDKGEGSAGVKDPNALPGAEVGNYLGMKAWEQGRMDYQGADSSDNVIKRLQFLMMSRSSK